MMRVKDIATLLTAATAFLGSATALVKALQVQHEEARTYQGAAEMLGDQASEILELQQRLAKLEANHSGGRR